MQEENYWQRIARRGVSRRGFLRSSALFGGGIAGLTLIGCGSSNNSNKNTSNQSAATVAASAAATTAGASTPRAGSPVTGGSPAAGATKAAGNPRKGGTVRLGNPDMTGQFSPDTTTNANDWALLFAIYDPLVTNDASGAVTPYLASSWEIADASSVTLKLVQNATFHDGTPFNADAVVRNVKRTLGLGTKSRVYSQWSVVDTISATDSSTVAIKLKQPQVVPFLAVLTSIAGCMPSPSAIESAGDNYNQKPIGTGPFKIDSIDPGHEVKVSRFANYWQQGMPYLDGLDFQIAASLDSLVASMRAGQLDYIHTPLSVQQVEQLKPTAKIWQGGMHAFSEFRLNVGKAPLNNPDLLKAFGYALDRDSILKGIFLGQGQVAGGPINPNTWAWNPNYKGFTYDTNQAKALLSKAGMPSGFAFTDKIGSTTGFVAPLAQAAKDQLAKVGINLTLNQLPAGAPLDFLYQGDFDAYGAYTPQYSPDPDSIFRPNFYSTGQYNYHNFKHPDFDKLLDDAAGIADQEKRKQLYWQAQDMLFDLGMPRMPFVFIQTQIPSSQKLDGLYVTWDGYGRFTGAWLNA